MGNTPQPATERQARELSGLSPAACEQAGIIPETVVYEGEDLAEYVIDANVARRNMPTGARAMATALVLMEDGRRIDGKWDGARGRAIIRGSSSTNDESAWVKALSQSGVVLDFRSDLAQPVVNGTMALDAAYREACTIRDSADHERVMERERKKREKKEAAQEAEKNARIVADLTQAGATDLLADIESGRFTPATAWAAHLEATRKERKHREDIERGPAEPQPRPWRASEQRSGRHPDALGH